MTADEQLELNRVIAELEATRAAVRQLRTALADLVPPHASWCMGHEGGVREVDGVRVGVGPRVVVDCRCDHAVQSAREALAASARVLAASARMLR